MLAIMRKQCGLWLTLGSLAFVGSAVAQTVSAPLAVEAPRSGASVKAASAPVGVGPALPLSSNGTQTIGLVLTDWHFAMHETHDAKEECPDGFQYGNVDNYLATYKTQTERDEMHLKYGFTQHRGKNGENIFIYPEAGHDPLPFREVQSKISYGQDLDGKPSGEVTATTCPHENFTSPDGRKNIDNQLYRVVACQKPLRRGGFYDARFNEEKTMRLAARFLLEISDVDDMMNDESVIVASYKGRDKIVKDPAGNVVPFLSQRVDDRDGGRYTQRTKGKIVNGVLYTEPLDLLLSTATHNLRGETFIKDMRLELKLNPTSAEGLVVGYHDLKQWFKQYPKQSMSREHVTPVSGPSVYEAAVRLADGHKDPVSGQCTSISTAYDAKFTRVFVVHPEKGEGIASAKGSNVKRLADASPAASN